MVKKKNQINSTQTIDRRSFLKQATLGTLGLTFGQTIFKESLFARRGKSKVVLVRHPKVIDMNGKVHIPLLKDMIARAMVEFTGKNNLKEAWSPFVPKARGIGIKLNTLGLSSIRNSPFTDHYSALTSVLVEHLKKTGVNDKDLIIWDRSDEELVNAGLTLQKAEGKMRVMGVKSGRRGSSDNNEYHPSYHAVGDKKVRLCRLLTDNIDTLISIPILKHHQLAGITASLKSHFGSIDDPRQFHSTRCINPGIPELNAIPIIRKKQKLIIADCLMGLYHGGPWWNPKHIWPYGGIVIGSDPVAVDTVLLDIMDKKRKAQNLVSLKESVKQLTLSEKLGLGNSNPVNIDLKTIDLS